MPSDIAELQLVTTPYDPIANLVNAQGRSQAVIKLTSAGDTSWRVSEAIMCPKRPAGKKAPRYGRPDMGSGSSEI
jgi:hypothetical protein